MMPVIMNSAAMPLEVSALRKASVALVRPISVATTEILDLDSDDDDDNSEFEESEGAEENDEDELVSGSLHFTSLHSVDPVTFRTCRF